MERGPQESAPGDGEPAPPDLRMTGERIDALIEALAAGGGPASPARSRERAEELVRVVTDLYGAGLERLLDIAYESGRLDDELLGLLADDELVASLLLVHGLHPYDVRTRVERALEGVRPYLGSHGGDVELLTVTDDGRRPPPPARLLRRLPVLVRDARARGPGRHRGRGAGDQLDRGGGRRLDGPRDAHLRRQPAHPPRPGACRLDGRRRVAPAARGPRPLPRPVDRHHRRRGGAVRVPGRAGRLRLPQPVRRVRVPGWTARSPNAAWADGRATRC